MRVSAANVRGSLGPAARAAVSDMLLIVVPPAEIDPASCLLHCVVIALGRIGPDPRAAARTILRRFDDPAHDEDDAIVLALDRIGEPPVRKLIDRLRLDASSLAFLRCPIPSRRGGRVS